MNKSYKSIWNETLGTYVAAAEVASSSGRKVSSGRRARRAPARALVGQQLALEQRIVFDAAVAATVVDTQEASAPAADPVPVVEEVHVTEAPEPAATPVAATDTEESSVPAPTAAPTSTTQTDAPDTANAGTETGGDADVDPDAVAEVSEADGDDTTTDTTSPASAAGAATDGDADVDAGDDVDALSETDLAAVDAPAERVEIIFVDSVAKDIVPELSWHPGEIYVLDADRDGVEQMAEILNGRTGVDAIHIISHGTAGSLELGNTKLDAQSLEDEHADEMAIIAASLSEGADLLLYGCDVSSTEAGLNFVNLLAEATGADVAASNDDTGSEALGGDWVLETRVGGEIETTVITAEQWAGVLTPVTTGAGAILAASGMSIYSIDVTTGKATLLTTVPNSVGGVTLSTSDGLNSLAVDQANGLLYYVSNTGNNANRALFAYDLINNTHILIASDLTSSGVVVGDRGVGSGGAVFANGSLYLGVENNNGGGGSSTAADDAIYRINLASDGRSVTSASLLVGSIGSNDWGDLGYDPASNTILSIQTGSVVRYNATTGAQVSSTTLSGNPTQASTGQNDTVYLVGGSGVIRTYDPSTGTMGTAVNITTASGSIGSINDAAGWVPPTGTIGDLVFADANGNGVQDAGEVGIAGVTVALYDDVNNDGVVDANDRLLGTATTDATGKYEFTGVLPGNYIVRVTDTGNVLGTGAVYTTPGGATNATVDITQVGASNLNADFGISRAPVNTVPGAQNTPEDSPLVFNADNGNALSVADPDGGTLTATVQVTNGTFTLGSTSGVTVSGNGSGSVVLTGSASAINEALTNAYYTNTPDYNGSAQLTITTSDGRVAYQDVDTVAITVSPVADITNDSAITQVNTPVTIDVLATDSFEGTPQITAINGSAITAGGAAVAVSGGSVVLGLDGRLTFTPTTNSTADSSFTYTVTSGGVTETAQVTVVVNAPPVLEDPNPGDPESPEVDPTDPTNLIVPAVDGTQVTVDLDDYFSDPNPGDVLTITPDLSSLPPGVEAEYNPSTGVLTVTPPVDNNGPIVIPVTVNDGQGGTFEGTITIEP
ncbi:DUF4347 domain-containing protein, partial [Hydrogenophaga sp. NFH-34]|uniref:DUF4347 domain-containing protein n=1 Tax=Hydrogenophaga sp. NFH-34 TaxID=2744446 RepID=UPI001F4220EA